MMRNSQVLPFAIIAVALSRVFSRSRKCGRLAILFGLLAVIAGGASNTGVAQTASFSYAIAVLGGGFNYPSGVAVDGGGNVYVADWDNNAVKEMPAGCASASCVTTLGGGFYQPRGVAVDGSGNVYVADFANSAVKEMPAGCASSSCVHTLGGGFYYPTSIALDSSGNIYVGDPPNSAVYEMPEGCPSSSCVKALGGAFLDPTGVAVDGSGNVYVSEYDNSAVTEMPAECASSSCVTTLGGGFNSPVGVAVDSRGNVYVADSENNQVKEMPPGCASSSCVTALGGGFYDPDFVAVDGSGDVYFGDGSNSAVQEIMTRGVNFFTVSVGTASAAIPLTFTFNSAGSLSSHQVLTQGAPGLDFNAAVAQGSNACNGTTAYATGNTCTVNVTFAPTKPGTRYGAVELLNADGGTIATAYVYGTGVGPQVNFLPGTQSTLPLANISSPWGIAVDAAGSIFLTEAVTAYSSSNAVVKESWSGSGYTQTTVATGLAYPRGVAVDGAGKVYIADQDASSILVASPSGSSYVVNTLFPDVGTVLTVAVDGSGNVYFTSDALGLVKETYLGTNLGYSQSTIDSTGYYSQIAVDAVGNIYLPSSSSTYAALKETLTNGTYTLSQIGSGSPYGWGLAVDGQGNVYVESSGGVLKETPSGGSYVGSLIPAPAVDGAGGLAVDSSGNIYGTGAEGNTVWKVDVGDSPVLHFAATAPGHTSTDSPQTLVIENTGNAALNIPIPSQGSNPSIPAGFTVIDNAVSACPQVNANSSSPGTLAVGASCDFVISYSPQSASDSSGWLDLTYDGPNEATSSYLSASIPLIAGGALLTPSITWATPSAITYGTPLSGLQQDATAPVPGSFNYSPAAGTVLHAGSQTITATFTPVDTQDFTSATASVTLVVNQVTPIVTWAAPAAITYGTALGTAQLNASSTVAGSFSYSPVAGTVLTARSHTITATFTPTDTTDYTAATASVTLTVNQATPTITWATPVAITYGTALGAAQLNASSTIAGSFSYSPAAGTVLSGGSQTITTTFTPTDATDYTSSTASVTVMVNQATPTITWATPAAITYGTALGAVQLNATSTAAGSFSYSPAAGAVLTVGSHTVTATFTPTYAADYTSATASVTVTVNQATPVITWATPVAITYGTALGAAQLNASSTVAGSYSYSPVAGTVLTAGLHTITTTFTPTDTTDYTTATASVSLTVNRATPAITWAPPAAITYGTALGASQLNASSTIAGTFSYSPAAGTVLTPGSHIITATFAPTDTTDYTSATATVTLTVNQVTQSITFTPPTSPVTYPASPITLSATGGASGNPVVFSVVSGPGTLSGTNGRTLTITNAGTVVVAANQAGNTDYSAASQVTQSIVVNPPAVPILLSPTPGLSTVLGISNVTFQWTPAAGATEYELDLSAKGPGQQDLFSYKGTATMATAQSLPENGLEVYATVYCFCNGAWHSNAFVYSETNTQPAQLISPTPGVGTVLGTTNVAFQWSAGVAVTEYQFELSSISYQNENLFVYKGTATSAIVPTVPANAGPVYATLYSMINGAWQVSYYEYTESGMPTPAVLTSPTPGVSTILGTSNVAFEWTAGLDVTDYQLNLSAIAPGGSELFTYKGTATTVTAPTLPGNAAKVYARLFSDINGGWQFIDYVYTESGTLATLTSPTPGLGTVLGTGNVVFKWTAGIAVTAYQLNLSSIAPGESELLLYKGTATTATALALPAKGGEVYARLYSYVDGAWQFIDYVYTESGTPTPATLTSPTPGLGTVLGTSSVIFQWSAGFAVTEYQLNLSAIAAGESELFLYKGTATSAAVLSLPANGVKVYARLYSYVNGAWQFIDYVYTESGTATPAALTSPTPGLSTIVGTSDVTFQWSAGISVTDYQLNLSAIAAGDSELFLYKGTATTATAPTLPANGVKVYARLYSYLNGAWQYNDYVYTER
jgi:streptogramin lyase